MEPDPITISSLAQQLVELIKVDHWVGAVISAIVAIVVSSFGGALVWFFRVVRRLITVHYREAKQFNGDWYLYHWSLVKVTDHKIRVSLLHVRRRLNGRIDAFQIHPVTRKKVYFGGFQFDSQNIYVALDCLNDTDEKSIIFHRFVNFNDVNLRYAVGVMSGITHQRSPYACKVLLADRLVPEKIMEKILGRRNVLSIDASERDKALSLNEEEKKIVLEDAPLSSYTSSLLNA